MNFQVDGRRSNVVVLPLTPDRDHVVVRSFIGPATISAVLEAGQDSGIY